MHGFIVASVFLFNLLAETLSLIFRIIELAEAVGQFTAAYEELKAVSDKRIGIVTTGQRRHFPRVLCNKRRLFEFFFGSRFKNFAQIFTGTPDPIHFGLFNVKLFRHGFQLIEVRFRVTDSGFICFWPVFQDSFTHTQAVERFTEVVVFFFYHVAFCITHGIHQFCGAQDIFSQHTQHVFGQVHQIVVICVGLIEFQHGKFRVVAGR